MHRNTSAAAVIRFVNGNGMMGLGGVGGGRFPAAVKLAPVMLALEIVSPWPVGEKWYPLKLGVMVYAPRVREGIV